MYNLTERVRSGHQPVHPCSNLVSWDMSACRVFFDSTTRPGSTQETFQSDRDHQSGSREWTQLLGYRSRSRFRIYLGDNGSFDSAKHSLFKVHSEHHTGWSQVVKSVFHVGCKQTTRTCQGQTCQWTAQKLEQESTVVNKHLMTAMCQPVKVWVLH